MIRCSILPHLGLDLHCFLDLSAIVLRLDMFMLENNEGLDQPAQTPCIITKRYLYSFDPLEPHFYIVKLGFTGVYIIFLISAQKHRLWVLVRTALARQF